jgi:phage terminase large subunit-like protein
MNLEKLKEISQYCLDKNKNYQHYGKSKDELNKLALDSFRRLNPEENRKIADSWAKYCKGVDTLDLIFYRFLAQTNLFFLCKLLEKYDQVSDNEYEFNDKYRPDVKKFTTHEYICNEFFVRKNPTFKTFEEFAKSYDGVKERLLLVPRGGFKSSIDIADCVQWIINWPEITILILTGVHGLAVDFVGELRNHFEQEQLTSDSKKTVYGPKTMIDGSNSMFQVLFPEHCVHENEGKQTEFVSPCRKIVEREPTVMAAGIEMALSGWHFGVMKLDDVVTNENSQTITRLQTVNKQVNINNAMLHPFGFHDKIGTWYDESDTYGVDLKTEDILKEEKGPAACSLIIHLRACWWATAEAKNLGKVDSSMTKDDFILWFPERLSYEYLREKQRKDPEGFAIKYLNDPKQVHQVKFPRELLVNRTIPATMLPSSGIVVQTWDAAYSVKSFADYTVGITALIHGGRFYIIDMARGRFNEYELPARMAMEAFKWKPKRISIEDSVGVKWMGRELRREMDKLMLNIPVEYVSLGFGTKAKSKEMKAKPVLRLLGDERLLFSNSCQGLPDIYTELEKFGTKADPKDDIVSGLSLLVEQYSSYADADALHNISAVEYVADRQSKARYDLIHSQPPTESRLAFSYNQWKAGIVSEDENPIIDTKTNVTLPVDVDPLEGLFN